MTTRLPHKGVSRPSGGPGMVAGPDGAPKRPRPSNAATKQTGEPIRYGVEFTPSPTPPETVRQNSAWLEGAEARRKGFKAADNPYRQVGNERFARLWEDGLANG